MLLTLLMLVVALCLSAVAAFYSIVGLTAIFAAAVTPIVLMGSILEVAKLTVTVWLHEHWLRARLLMKIYLSTAVVVLMMITSMGIFGFLSKAHMDQGMVSGDVQAKIAVYDEKIRTERENIDANRKALKQLDESVDQVMGRSQDEKGAEKAIAIRRAQQKERGRLAQDIADSQQKISKLNEERAPIAAEVRKVEAEVGPIKYIAALIYGDNPDANVLERAVRWVIILLVIVFDPLAVMMLLAATESRKWTKEIERETAYEADDGPLTKEQIEEIKELAKEDLPAGEVTVKDELFPQDPSPPGWMYNITTTTYPSTEEEIEELTQEFDRSKHAYLDKPFVHFENLKPMVYQSEESALDYKFVEEHNEPDYVSEPVTEELVEDDNDPGESIEIKIAKNKWKTLNPKDTLKRQRLLFEHGKIDHLPWLDLVEPLDTNTVFGKQFPENPNKGDAFINTEYLPTRLFKYNGEKWIEVDKSNSDSYAYNSAYIDYLIASVSSGEYDPELLTESERTQIETRLRENLK
jgi:hypothetical protein